MNKYLFLIFALIALSSCEKDKDTIIEKNSIAEDLKEVISQEGVQALQWCCEGCNCSQTIGWGTDYSFPGDNFVRIRDNYYNLNQLIKYQIKTVGTTTTEVRMVLTFP